MKTVLRGWIQALTDIPNHVYNHLIFLYRKVRYEAFPNIEGRIYMVCKPGAISFGKNVRINSSLRSNPIGGSTRTILFAEPGAKISIGNRVGISNSAIHAAESVTIEDDVLIGGNCKIYDTDFHSIDFDYRMENPDTHVKKSPINIGNGAFIGAHSVILKGVSIGERSVIAAGSVVTKSVPPNELWGGIPAKLIKTLNK